MNKYIVTKASDDGTFLLGDHITFCEDGSILCSEAGGWIERDAVVVATKGMESELDTRWISRRKNTLAKELKELNELNTKRIIHTTISKA